MNTTQSRYSRRHTLLRRAILEALEPRMLLTVTWAVGASGTWNDSNKWTDDLGVHRIPGTNDDVVIGPGSSVTANVVRVQSLTLDGSLTINASTENDDPAHVSILGTLALAGSQGAWTGKLDLTNNALIVRNATNVPDQIKQAANLGAWNGSGGITSSKALAAVTNSTRTGLGYATGAEYSDIIQPGTFNGWAYNTADTLVMYTLAGDANMDGSVNLADFSALQKTYNKVGDWEQGDWNYDGNVTLTDFAVLEQNYGKTLPLAAAANIWEPQPGSDNNWSTAANWSAGHVPTASDDVRFIASATVTVNANPAVRSLIVSDNSSVALNFDHTAASLAVAGGITLNPASGQAASLEFGVVNAGDTAVVSAAAVLGTGLGSSGLEVSSGISMATDQIQIQVGSLTIAGSVTINPHLKNDDPAHVSVLDSLTLAGTAGNWTGRLDLTNDAMIVKNGSNVAGQIKQAANLGAWTGAGGITSHSAYVAAGSSTAIALGYATGTEYAAMGKTHFFGMPFDPTNTLVMLTVAGDANMDGTVALADFSALQQHFNQPGDWEQGDWNYDGTVTLADFSVLQQNLSKTLPMLSAPTSVTAAANAAGDGAIIRWNGSPGATTYQVYQNGSVIGPLITATNATTYSYTTTSLSNGTYTYTVVALGATGTSEPSFPSTVEIQPPGLTPATPGNLTWILGTNGDGTTSFRWSTDTLPLRITLSWDAVPGVDGYVLQSRRVDPAESTGGPYGWTTIATISGSTSLDTLIKEKDDYRVRAFIGDPASGVLSDGSNVFTPDYPAEDQIVEVSAQARDNAITLAWRPSRDASGYEISRRVLGQQNWQFLAFATGTSTGWTDHTLSTGTEYEYHVARLWGDVPQAYGYVVSGITLPAVENRGTVVLLVDNTLTAGLAMELTRLQYDLIADGWNVIRHDVLRDSGDSGREAAVHYVKGLILQDYSDDSNVNTVFLIGHVPVPYSGDLAPDGHTPESSPGDSHLGAWPADIYYADMDYSGDLNGTWTDNWTDTSVNDVGAIDPRNHNIAQDGKFDQNAVPADADGNTNVELAVGRVDMANLSDGQGNLQDETTLLRAYLDKDHAFRSGQWAPYRTAVQLDRLGSATQHWSNFTALLGEGDNATYTLNPTPRNYSSDWNDPFSQTTTPYLWAAGSSIGWWDSSIGIMSTATLFNPSYAGRYSNAIFNMLVGSWFGDWDSQIHGGLNLLSNAGSLLRALLTSGDSLTVSWMNPFQYYQGMAMGGTVGESMRFTENTMGALNPTGAGILSQNVANVHAALLGDPTLPMDVVKPVKNIQVHQYYLGDMLSWDPSEDASDPAFQGYYVYRQNESGQFEQISGLLPPETGYWNDTEGQYNSVYMVRAAKLEGVDSGEYHSGSYVNLSQGVIADMSRNATFVGTDWQTQGNWNYTYGQNGYWIPQSPTIISQMPGWMQNAPVISTITQYGQVQPAQVTSEPSNDPRALVTANGGLQSQWDGGPTLAVDLDMPNGYAQQLSLYFVDWADAGLSLHITIQDRNTGQILDAEDLSDFSSGAYMTWDVAGPVRITIQSSDPAYSAVLSGIFV